MNFIGEVSECAKTEITAMFDRYDEEIDRIAGRMTYNDSRLVRFVPGQQAMAGERYVMRVDDSVPDAFERAVSLCIDHFSATKPVSLLWLVSYGTDVELKQSIYVIVLKRD